MNAVESLNWRYATKRMNGQKIPSDALVRILEAIRLAPTSLGLQPYSVYVIESDSTKQRIADSACTQPQVMESSHLLVFAAWKEYKPEQIDNYFDLIAKTRKQPPEALAAFRRSVESFASSKSPNDFFHWTSRQCYIALGIGLLAAASESVDSTPMEGFQPKILDGLLELTDKNEGSVLMMALGYRDSNNDPLAKLPKVRRPLERLVHRV